MKQHNSKKTESFIRGIIREEINKPRALNLFYTVSTQSAVKALQPMFKAAKRIMMEKARLPIKSLGFR